MTFLKVIALVAGFVIAGAAGGVVALSGVPQLRDNCEDGIVCFVLGALHLGGSRTGAPKDSSNETTTDCLSKGGRLVVYRLGLILIGETPPRDTELPASLDLGDAACVPIDKAAAKVCASLAHEWSSPEACVLATK
jgi:hypothetical protein